MLQSLIIFLIAVIVLAVLVYVARLFIASMPVTPEVRQISLVVVGAFALIALLLLALRIIGGPPLVLL